MTQRLLFAHDDWISFDEAGRPASHNYTRHLVDRYRYLADEVTFGVRCSCATRVHWFEDAEIACIPDMKHGRNLVRYGSARRAVCDLVASHDVVVARLPSLIGSWALRAAWKTKKPVLVEMVGCPWDALWNHSRTGQLVAPWFWAKNRRLLREATHTIYVTEQFLQKRYPTPGASVACSNVEVVMASEQQLANRLQRLENLTGNQPIVLGTIANLDVPYKGHDLVLRALASLPEGSLRFIYRMVGPGEPTRLLELVRSLGIEHCVEFFGSVPRKNIPATLDQIDLYLQPSRQEGLPRALLEAMSRGCVAIGARTGGIPELIEAPWLVPRNDWRSIASLLSRLPELDLGRAARDNVETASRYQLDRLEARRRQFYDKFLADHGLEPRTRVKQRAGETQHQGNP